MKKKVRLPASTLLADFTHWSLITPILSKNVRVSIPMIDDGTGTPVSHTTNSPNANMAKMMNSCSAIELVFYNNAAKVLKYEIYDNNTESLRRDLAHSNNSLIKLKK